MKNWWQTAETVCTYYSSIVLLLDKNKIMCWYLLLTKAWNSVVVNCVLICMLTLAGVPTLEPGGKLELMKSFSNIDDLWFSVDQTSFLLWWLSSVALILCFCFVLGLEYGFEHFGCFWHLALTFPFLYDSSLYIFLCVKKIFFNYYYDFLWCCCSHMNFCIQYLISPWECLFFFDL
jgi:hypothetical protein